MQFAVVNASKQTVEIVDCPDIRNAMALVDLDDKNVDHGAIGSGLGIVVYEFGMFTPPEHQSYFAIGRAMFAGNAVLYSFNRGGETVSLTTLPPIVFLPTAKAAERNIELGLIERPYLAVNDVITWRWPEPRTKVHR
jgi:hypothetical protein